MRRLVAVFAVLWAAGVCGGAVIRVEADGSGDYPTIQAAIEAALDGDSVILADGTYKGEGNRDIDIYDKAITIMSESGGARCIIDCEEIDGAFRSVGENSDTVLQGVTIINARCGIYCNQGTLILRDCTIRDCLTTSRSAGIECSYSNLRMHDCTVQSNDGVGLHLISFDAVIENCRFIRNNQSGVFVRESNPVFQNCIFEGNFAPGMYNSGSSPKIVNCVFFGNSGYVPPAVYNDYFGQASNPVITNSIFWGNVRLDEPHEVRPIGGGSPVVNYCCVEGGVDIFNGTGNIDDDPLFLSAVDGDFHLLAGSPCIDSGDPCRDYTGQADLDGDSRPIGERADMGVDEFDPNASLIKAWPGTVNVCHKVGSENPEAVVLQIQKAGSGEKLCWHITEDCDWFDVSPLQGESSGEADNVIIEFDVSSLTERLYSEPIYIWADDASNSPTIIGVSLCRYGFVQIVPDMYGTIQSAVDAAEDGDIVLVADGVYTGEGNTNITFRGKAITVKSENGAENCIIDCNGWGGFWFDSGEDEGSILDGFSIINGSSRSLFCRDASPTIRNCTLSNCGSGSAQPRVIELQNSNATFVNCTVRDSDGTGISAAFGSPRIEGCTISGNSRAGIRINTASAVIIDSIIERNRERGITFSASDTVDPGLLIDGCRIVSNCGGDGAGIRATGGGYQGTGAKLTRSVVSGNRAKGKGGGLYISGVNVEIDNCIISCNGAFQGGYGGGISIPYGKVKIDNSTVAWNAADWYDAIFQYSEPVTVTNSIFWGNTDSSGEPIGPAWPVPSFGNCCLEDDNPDDANVPFDDGWSGNIDDYPMFVREPNDGGDGWGDDPATADVDESANDDFGDLHLMMGSPCIEAGMPNARFKPASVDIDGEPRIMGLRVDIGADEVGPTAIVTVPEGGEVWRWGSIQEIVWVSDGLDSVDILLSKDGGASWKAVANVDANDGFYIWQVPAGVNSDECVLKIVPAEDGVAAVVGESGVFSIGHDYSPENKVKSEWPTLGGGVDRAGSSDVSGPLTGCVKWRFDMEGAVISSVTVGYKDWVHIACEKGVLYTLDKDGEFLWEVDVNSPLTNAPTVGPGGSVYVGAENGRLYAIDRKGAIRWTYDTHGPMYSAPAIGDDGKVYVCSADGRMSALDEDGTELWRVQTTTLDGMDGAIMASPAIGADGTIYVGGVYDANLYAVNPDGSMKWACSFARDVEVTPGATRISGWPVTSPVVGTDGTIYQTLVYDANLYAINPEDGSIKWASRMTPYCEWVEEHGNYPPDLSDYCDDWYGVEPNEWFYYGTGYSSLAMGPDSTIYVSFDDPYLRAVDPNGTIRWVTQLGEGAGFDLAVDSDGYIYAACEDGQLYVVSPDGTPISMFEADEWLGYPVVAEDGTVIVSGSRDNTMLKEPPWNSVWALSRDGCVDGALDLDLIADLNGDGVIDAADLLLIADDWLGDKRADKGQAAEQRGQRPTVERQMKGTR